MPSFLNNMIFSTGIRSSQRKRKTSVFLCLLAFLHCVHSGDETFSGGRGTSFDFSLNAFNRHISNLKDNDKIMQFNRGNQIFKAAWSNDGGPLFQGLGPLFNSRSCNGCHFLGGRGRNRLVSEKEFHFMIFRVRGKAGTALENYGAQIQDRSVSQSIPPEAVPDVKFSEISGNFPDGSKYSLMKPEYKISKWNYGIPEQYHLSPRVPPAVYGMGLLQMIPEETVREFEDTEDRNGDGISGRMSKVNSRLTGKDELGRFGWKAAQPDVIHITANALHQDMGITSDLFPKQNCEPVQSGCIGVSSVSPEIDSTTLKDLVYSVMMTAVPGRRNLDTQEGRRIFSGIGCAKCHRTEMKTGIDPDFPELSNQKIHPYSDLLLHEMGEELSDEIKEGSAEGSEWRTPPLWGLGLYSLVNQHSFLLHDGRARNAEEAVLWHGGEAFKSREKYRSLSRADREKLLDFLYSL